MKRHSIALGSSVMMVVLSNTGCSSMTSRVAPINERTLTVKEKLERIQLRPQQAAAATIRRTSYSVPHIVANDWLSLGFGAGYAFSEDNACLLADQVIRVRGQRSQFFGKHLEKTQNDNANLNSDFGMLALGYHVNAAAKFNHLPAQSQAVFQGYSEGYNQFITEHRGPWPTACAVARLGRITAVDLFAYHLLLAGNSSGVFIAPYIIAAQAPAATTAAATTRIDTALSALQPTALVGSNGWAIGQRSSANGHGALLANPHFPDSGNLRFYEQHLTIPGYLNVSGASLALFPMVNIGFNQSLAWTHTVSFAPRLTLHQLELDPKQPTRYRVDGQYRAMQTQTLRVTLDNGQVEERIIYLTDFGPVIHIPGTPLAWGAQTAYAFADANRMNPDMVQHWLELNLANTLAEFKQVFHHHHGTPWVNTLVADKDGNSYYVDGSVVPNLSNEEIQQIQQDPLRSALLKQMGLWVLPGTHSHNNWLARVHPFKAIDEAPAVENRDYVLNANGSPWLVNPQQPTPAYSPLYGRANERMSIRTRYNFALLEQAKASNGVEIGEMIGAVYQNGVYLAELIKADLVALCKKRGEKPVTATSGASINIAKTCDTLATWDGKAELDSRGAHVFAEFAQRFVPETMFAQAFHAQHPLQTPAKLSDSAEAAQKILQTLADVSEVFARAGVAVDARLADVQFLELFDYDGSLVKRIPMHGTTHLAGGFNLMEKELSGYGNGTVFPQIKRPELSATGLTTEGYPIRHGSSWVMAVGFDAKGPQAMGVNAFSQSTDARSPHFSDQHELFMKKQARKILFREDDIVRDPKYRAYQIKGKTQAAMSVPTAIARGGAQP